MNASAAIQETRVPQGQADAATLALVDELKSLAADLLGGRIERMLDGADDMLFEMARRATNNQDQRIYFDAMRVMRLGRSTIAKVFGQEIVGSFGPGSQQGEAQAPTPIVFKNLSLQETKALEESIAVSAMAAKAENLFSAVLFELGRRIEWLIHERGAPLSPAALTPATISGAFRRSAEALEVDFDVELVIFKLFDRFVISDLGELYSRVLQLFDQAGVESAPIGAAIPRPARPAGTAAVQAAAPAAVADRSLPAAPQGYGFPQPPMMDAATLQALRSLASGSVGFSGQPTTPGYYGDIQLSAQLAAAASGQVVPGWEAPRAFAYVQRAGAVGRMFNELMLDPSLPAPLKPRFDQLRFSVIKSALRDARFFADRQHPVRGLLKELGTLAASARASGMDALRRIEELVGQIQTQFDIAANEVLTQSAEFAAVDEDTLQQFFAQQQDDARQRRRIIIERARRVVAEELHLQTLGRSVPPAVRPLLNAGWAPLAALRLLKHGPDGEAWQQAMALLRRLLDSVDPRSVAARDAENLRALESALDAQLREVGMLDERVYTLLDGWRDAVRNADAAASASEVTPTAISHSTAGLGLPPDSGPRPDAGANDPAASTLLSSTASAQVPDANVLLDRLMVLSSWFRVYDHDRAQNRWLKVVSHQAAEGIVTFAEFNGQNPLALRTQLFLDDLVHGRAEPIDVGPAARRLLDAYLVARRAAENLAVGLPA